jgi:uncharacterized protein YkwD
LQKLRILPLAAAAGLLLPAVPAFAAPTYTSLGSTTYFGAVLGSPLVTSPAWAAFPQPTPAPSQPATTPVTPSAPSTSFTSTAATFSVGSTSYFVTGLGQRVTQLTPPATAPSSATSGGTGSSVSAGSGGTASASVGSSPGSSSSTEGGGTGASPQSNSSLDAQFLALVNQARQQAGVGTLADSPTLDELALAKAQDMVTYGYVAHYSPRLGWPVNQETAAGFEAQSMGAENIAEAGTIQRAMIDLMSDPGHRANLLDPSFTQTGIAVLPVTGGVLVEELFAGPSF